MRCCSHVQLFIERTDATNTHTKKHMFSHQHFVRKCRAEETRHICLIIIFPITHIFVLVRDFRDTLDIDDLQQRIRWRLQPHHLHTHKKMSACR